MNYSCVKISGITSMGKERFSFFLPKVKVVNTITYSAFCMCLSILIAIQIPVVAQGTRKPKLVVGIIVDQMRQDYLYRFYDKYGEGGFKRLLNKGFELKNAHYNYVPTVTAPGHASVYTGTTPAIHGIVENEWYDARRKKDVYCVADEQHKLVGQEDNQPGASPSKLLATTITDDLKVASRRRSKVIGISVKDRAAVLPAGHLADAAYWYSSGTGDFISSTYYVSKLPEWVKQFNQRKLAEKYLSQTWNTLYDISKYIESDPDETPYEARLFGKASPVFPYNLKEMKEKGGFNVLSYTPFSNDYITEFAKACLDGEKMGQSGSTDFLAISYSATDILGHAMGPNSVEIEDMYLRLDKNLEDLLKVLDSNVGAQHYTLFLTADHAVADVAQYLKDSRLPGGYLDVKGIEAGLNEMMQKYFPGKSLIDRIENGQVYLNHEVFNSNPRSGGIDLIVASELIANYLLQTEGIANVFTENTIRQTSFDESGLKGMVARGFHPKRSGDITVVAEPGWYAYPRAQGSTHGSPYTYDTHVPVIFYGWGVPNGSSVQYHPITDVAPTLAILMGIKIPSGCTGKPVAELFHVK